MPDFRAFVRDQIAPLALPPERELKIVEEWAVQLEDAYDALRAQGLSGEEAWRNLQRHVPDWGALGRELLLGEGTLARVEHRTHQRSSLRRVLIAIRESLTAGAARDLRGSLRLLVRQPGFSATVILTLAVCLGANAAIFTVVHAVLLRPLPVPEPARLVVLGDVYPTITPDDIFSNDAPSYVDRLEALTALEEQALFAWWFDTLTIDGVPIELRGMRATPSLFRVLRVPPALGRTFTDAEAEVGQDRSIVLSHALWQRMYGGDPGVIGRTLRLGWTGRSYTIVGVMPRDFAFFDRGYDGHAAGADRGAQFWIPLALTPQQKSDEARTRYGFFHIGRLRPDATVEQVKAQADALTTLNVERFPQFNFAELGMYTAVTPLQEALTRGVRRPLYLLWGGAGFVLLIGAINVANLSIARASARRRELATRLALGATRLRLARQLVTEACVPAALGGAAGIAIGTAVLRALAGLGLDHLPNTGDLRLGAPTVAFVALVSMAAGALIGLAPAAGARHVGGVLAGAGRGASDGRRSRLLRRTLVVAQVAISVVLLAGAAALAASVRHLLGLDAGFRPEGVLTATIFPPPSRYPDAAAVVDVSNRLLDRLRAIPGVQAAGVTSNVALSGFDSPASVTPAERAGSPEPPAFPSVIAVSPGYLEAMGTPLVRGRLFAAGDRERAPLVAIVDARLANRLWPGENPVGRTIYRGDAGPFTVVGVVGDVRYAGLAESIESAGAVYLPHAQAPPARRLRWIAVKSAGEPSAVVRAARSAALEIDPLLPLADVQTMGERTARAIVSQRVAAAIAGSFAAVALFLSTIGLYGVLATLVARRRRELGIRMALGSTVRGIVALVLTEGAALVGAGLVLGAAGALATAGALEGLVFGVQPADPRLLALVALGTGAVALLACVAPARRAARVDPVHVLSEP